MVGTPPKLIEHLLEIRGLGIINVMTLFERVNSNPKQIRLNINLENWDKNKLYDRVGLNEETLKILDTEITKNNPCKTRKKRCCYYRSSCNELSFKYHGY